MTIVRVLGRFWIPLVVLLVIGTGGFIVSRVHGIFGSEKRPSYAEGHITGPQPLLSKQVRYEVFGPAGTVADISYFDVNAQPQRVDGAQLPWSLTLTSNSPAVVADIVAQGDRHSIGCRIMIEASSRPKEFRTK